LYTWLCMGIAQFEATLCVVADDSNLDGRGQTGARRARVDNRTRLILSV
jgi:hypothetical protein